MFRNVDLPRGDSGCGGVDAVVGARVVGVSSSGDVWYATQRHRTTFLDDGPVTETLWRSTSQREEWRKDK